MQAGDAGLLDTATIAGILDTAEEMPGTARPDHPSNIRPGRLPPQADTPAPAAALDTAASTQALLSTQQHESLQQWRHDSHSPPGLSHPAALESSDGSTHSTALDTAVSTQALLSTQQHEKLQQWRQESRPGLLQPPVQVDPSAAQSVQQQQHPDRHPPSAWASSQVHGSDRAPSGLHGNLLSTQQHEDLQQWRQDPVVRLVDPTLQRIPSLSAATPQVPASALWAAAQDQQLALQPTHADDLPRDSRGRSAEASLVAEQAAEPALPRGFPYVPGTDQAAVPAHVRQEVAVTPGGSSFHGILNMEDGADETQRSMLDTTTSIQGLLSTQQHAEMHEDADASHR